MLLRSCMSRVRDDCDLNLLTINKKNKNVLLKKLIYTKWSVYLDNSSIGSGSNDDRVSIHTSTDQ